MFSEELLRSVQPTSVLPVTRNMPYYTASVPSRNQPRNMTGIYLGLEGNINPPHLRGVNYCRVRKGTSAKQRTPSEDRRYKIVESLRVKEEIRGFKGQPLKKKPVTPVENSADENKVPKCSHPQQLKHRKWGPAKSADPRHFNEMIKQNPRNFTSIMNNGVTRSENLTGMMSFAEQFGWDAENMPLPEALVEEVQRMAQSREDLQGLEECFKKVCKGNPDSLQSLLPLRKTSARPGSYTTGFTVRSYRNPKTAEILADFESAPPPSRPKTVPSTALNHQRQAFVPAPYFFKHFNKPLTANTSTIKRNSPSSQFEADQNNSLSGEKIFGAPGSGAVSRSIRTGRTSAWSEDGARLRRGTPRNDSPIKEIERLYNASTPRHDNSPNSTGPLELRAEGFQLNNNTDDRTVNPDHLTSTHRSNVNNATRTVGASDNMAAPGTATLPADNVDRTIRLDLETEDGKKQEIYLDDKEPNGNEHDKQRRESLARVATMQEDAKQRRRALEQILTEHDEIVKTITRQSSGTFQTATDDTRHQ